MQLQHNPSIRGDLSGRILNYEEGNLGETEELTLFQDLVNSGLAWQLQGHYGRTASSLLRAGLISPFDAPLKLSIED